MPPYLRRLVQGFCWASDADLVNALGVLLTGLLGNHFVDDPKPLVILDGNPVYETMNGPNEFMVIGNLKRDPCKFQCRLPLSGGFYRAVDGV